MRHDEDNIQIACVRWFSMQYPEYAPLLHHSPNGGRRNLREAARFKAMGTKSGFPDLFLAVARGGYHGLFVEMKSDRGRQSETQKQWQHSVEWEGYRYEVCRSLNEFLELITDYMRK